MNGLDDDDIPARLTSLFDDEPPMRSVAVDDLARGRRLLRRRRRSAVVATATALPAVLVGGWALGAVTLGSSGTASKLQPVDDAGPSDAGGDGAGVVCWIGSASGDPSGGGSMSPPDSDPTGNPSREARLSPTAPLTSGTAEDCASAPFGGEACSTVSLRSLPSGADPGKGSVVGDPSPDPADGGEPGTIGFACDDLGMVLQQHADPNAEHNGTMASGTAEATAGGGSESASASMGWADGGREGQVSLSVEQRSTSADCLDPSLGAGPEVNCERTTLDDGTVVWVGHGAQAGARRVAVEYERPDGSVVWATADEATDAWWRGDHARDPLTAPPMTFDDLVAMARDKAIK